jgi:hypothetical protein
MQDIELGMFLEDVRSTFPFIGERCGGGLVATAVAQPWFARHRILRIELLMMTGLRFFGCRGHGHLALLSGRLDRLEELVRREAPRGLDPESVVAYAEACDTWTAPYDLCPISVTSLEDLELIAPVGDLESLRDLDARLAGVLGPPTVARAGDDLIVTRCVLNGRSLVSRRLTISGVGVVRRDDHVLAPRLPAVARPPLD